MDTAPVYRIGNPSLQDLWIDPESGSDAADGASRSRALKTIAAAWNRIPPAVGASAHGFRLLLCPGAYPADAEGHVTLRGKRGTHERPILLQPADATTPLRLPPLDVYDSSFLYVMNLTFTSTKLEHISGANDNLIHFQNCDHILLRGVSALGDDRPPGLPRIGLKANQCSHLYIEECEFSGATAYAFAYVAVHYGHIVRSRFSRSNFAGLTLKGGSAYHLVAGNEISDCRVAGINVGEGTGFPYMVPPWLHYEAYDIKVVNNLVRNCGAGLGVGGGGNVLLAYNTCYRVGSSRDTMLVALGQREWIAANPACEKFHALGGWCLPGGSSLIPNRNIQICNNVVFNPDGFESAFAHFGISGPVLAPPESNIPSPAGTENLRIEGNVIWNGGRDKAVLDPVENLYGLAALPTVDPESLRAANHLNTLRPELADAEKGDYRPVAGGSLFSAKPVALADFNGEFPSIPRGDPDNAVATDRSGRTRERNCVGAYAG